MVHSFRKAWKRIRGSRQVSIARKLRTGQRTGHSIELSRDEARFMFDRLARRELGLSGDEFLRKLDAGELPDSPVVEHLALLAGGPRAG